MTDFINDFIDSNNNESINNNDQSPSPISSSTGPGHELAQADGSNYEGVKNSSSAGVQILKRDDRSQVLNILNQFLDSIQPISFREAAGIQEDVAINDRIRVVVVIDYVVNTALTKGWALARYENSFYLFTGTHWQLIDSDEMKSFLGKASLKIGVEYFIARHYKFRDDLLKQFHSVGYFSPPILDKRDTMINLLNGTFVISMTGSYLRDFDRNDFIRYQLPFGYDPAAKCPKFLAYLERVLPDKEKQKVIAEYFGYVFIPNSVLKLEKSMILYGSGQNGKSVFFDIIQELLGPLNVSNFNLQSLTDPNGYTRSLLSGKLVNYASEISSKMNPTLFKQLVSGEPIEARMIYGKPFLLRDYARLVFNTNVLPKDIENNAGFFRRFIIVEFDQTISDGEKNPMLANEIINEELPGVFNWILEGLGRLLGQRDFTYSEAITNAVERFKRESDSVALFLEDGGYIPCNDDNYALKEFYTKYKDFCKDSNYSACSVKSFSKRLKNYGYIITRKATGRYIGLDREV